MPNRDDSTRQAIRVRLRELIASARPGDRLPSERELAARWGAARMTVRNATDSLVSESLVERRHGSGTYVLPRPVIRFLGLTSFTQDMRERGLVAGSRLLEFGGITADAELAVRLRVDVGRPVTRFARLRTGGGEPMAVETTWIATALVPGLAPSDLDGSLYELLARRHGLVTASAGVTIEPVVPDAAARELLGIPADQACLRLTMQDADARGRVIMAADCLYRGDKYRLSANVADAAYAMAPARRAG
ncbi:MAG: GntR family transcriptional regulator [Chloroflexota bacterium]